MECSQVGQGTANEVELLNLHEELERKEEKYELDKGRKKDTVQGMVVASLLLLSMLWGLVSRGLNWVW